MAPKAAKNRTPSSDPFGIFSRMVVFLVENGVQPRRLQIWKQKLVQMGATIEGRLSKDTTHVFAMDSRALLQQFDRKRIESFPGKVLAYQWLEDSLRSGEKVSEDLYRIEVGLDQAIGPDKSAASRNVSSGDEEASARKKTRSSLEGVRNFKADGGGTAESNAFYEVGEHSPRSAGSSPLTLSPTSTAPQTPSTPTKDLSSLYSPPDLNRNITEIFGKLINIYRALGDDRRSFSYHKAIPVIEKLPFKIESSDQVKDLPGIGKSLQDHIQEILTTGKLSKLEHFETDEKVHIPENSLSHFDSKYLIGKMIAEADALFDDLLRDVLGQFPFISEVRTISLFGEVWGIGPTTALKLHEKGYRTLDDLKNEVSLTHAQKLGLKYFNDIKTRIPRSEVQEMEQLLHKVGVEILPGVVIVCGGSYRRGKGSCGDLDVVITHPDGKSHKGFLSKFVKRLKDMKFLREDLVFSTHSEEGTDSGVDTYFGLCTYPRQELRHRIDFKVYPIDIYAFGLIAWTGNDVLNRRLRLLAETKGFRLDDTGLFPATQSSGGKRGIRGSASLKFDTEKEVFDFLGFPWLEPNERNL